FPELAVEHALAAGDGETANRLCLTNLVVLYNSGQSGSIRRWLQWFDDQQLTPNFPALTVLGALFFSGVGPPAEAERWAQAAEHPSLDLKLDDGTTVATRAAPERILPDGSTLASWLAVLRVLFASHGIAGVRGDVQIALNGLSPSSGYRAVVIGSDACCDLFEGRVDEADAKFAQAADIAAATGRAAMEATAIGERGLIASQRGNADDAEAFMREALSIIKTG